MTATKLERDKLASRLCLDARCVCMGRCAAGSPLVFICWRMRSGVVRSEKRGSARKREDPPLSGTNNEIFFCKMIDDVGLC